MQITPRPVLSLAPYRLTVMALEWTQCEQRSFIDLCRDSWGGQVRAIGRTLMINIAGEKRVSRFGLAVRLVSRRTSVRIRFGSPFSSVVVVCGNCLVTLSLTINETLKWLSQLPILMKKLFRW